MISHVSVSSPRCDRDSTARTLLTRPAATGLASGLLRAAVWILLDTGRIFAAAAGTFVREAEKEQIALRKVTFSCPGSDAPTVPDQAVRGLLVCVQPARTGPAGRWTRGRIPISEPMQPSVKAIGQTTAACALLASSTSFSVTPSPNPSERRRDCMTTVTQRAVTHSSLV